MTDYRRGFGTKTQNAAARSRNTIWARLHRYHAISIKQLADKEKKSESEIEDAIRQIEMNYGGQVRFDIRSRLPGNDDDNIYEHWAGIDESSSLNPWQALKD